MKTIYLSGPMTGHPDFNRAEFHRVAATLTGEYTVLNPANIRLISNDQSWSRYMREALTIMLRADVIYMLKGWEGSVGARIEYGLAVNLGMEVIYA